jgi:geranylgeranyl diphosphate synthase type I
MSSLSQHFDEFLPLIASDLRTVLAPRTEAPPLFYRMLYYHMGWVDAGGRSIRPEGGKCIRPVLCLLVCKATCGDHTPARPAAAAIELIHNFSLLHDDIEDQSPLRRNRPTVWSIWGEKQAINAGDAMFALAHLAIPRLGANHIDRAVQSRMVEIVDETSIELTCGQHLDIAFEDQDRITIDDYLSMIGGKTATLVAAAAHLGALAGRAEDIDQNHYRAFGQSLGMAFQVCDDMLDIWGDPALTGKQAAHDIVQRKKSLPVVYGLERSPELRALYADPQPFDEGAVRRAVDLLENVGAREVVDDLARQYSDETIAHLEAANPSGDAGEALFELVHQLLHREH